jgi:hypothetical protein
MSTYQAQVAEAVQALAIQLPITYSWFGKPAPRLSARTRQALTSQTARNYLLFQLETKLYGDFYCRGGATAQPLPQGSLVHGRTPFVAALSTANAGRGGWEPGWEVRAVAGDVVTLRRGGLTITAHTSVCDPGDDLAPGQVVALHIPKELLASSPGFYMAVGDTGSLDERAGPLVRFYWHLTAEAAVPFLAAATAALNGAGVPFRLKVDNDPGGYVRCDSGVLYVFKRDYERVAAVVRAVYPQVARGLRPATPVFTKRLAPGLGLAEDPGSKDSFGQHRCRLLGDGLIRAAEAGQRSLPARLAAIAARFAEDGISLDAPFLNPGATDIYDLALPTESLRVYAGGSPATSSIAALPAADAAAYLAQAQALGDRLVRAALWSQDWCNWLSPSSVPDTQAGEPSRPGYGPLTPDLYAGTSGVGLFLAELAAITGDPAVRRTALGAVRQALGQAESIPPEARLGLYAGWPGIAYAAARVGQVLGEVDLVQAAAALLARTAQEQPDPREFDLIYGRAGTIAALLYVHRHCADESLLAAAVRRGDELLQTAQASADGIAWVAPQQRRDRPWTGFSHGTAGAGYALLELYAATGDTRYRSAAEGAFRYERHWFDAAAGNWPDFRGVPRRRRPGEGLAYGLAWCHGAPGIALSRLRAAHLLDDPTYRAEAQAGLDTTRKSLAHALAAGSGNFSLCHGLAGNADILLYGRSEDASDGAAGVTLAHQIAASGIARHGTGTIPWPCGVPHGGELPGLMLGLAGIGLYYLRLCNPAIPSVLIIHP